MSSIITYAYHMTLRIVSSNIRFENSADMDHNWASRKNLLAQTLMNFDPDVIGTQEGRQPQLIELENLLEGYQLIDDHRDWITERMYPCIYINSEKIEVIRSGDIWLSDSPDVSGSSSFGSAFPRLCTWAELRQKKRDKNFFLINTHLDHILSETRLEQIKVLINESKNKNVSGSPVILIGDFNDDPESQVRREIIKAWPSLYDPWHSLRLQEETSYHKFKGSHDEGARIDWILVDKKIQSHDVYLDKTSKGGLYPSDHFPLMGIFEL